MYDFGLSIKAILDSIERYSKRAVSTHLPSCPEGLIALMLLCCDAEPENRPSAEITSEFLRDMISDIDCCSSSSGVAVEGKEKDWESISLRQSTVGSSLGKSVDQDLTESTQGLCHPQSYKSSGETSSIKVSPCGSASHQASSLQANTAIVDTKNPSSSHELLQSSNVWPDIRENSLSSSQSLMETSRHSIGSLQKTAILKQRLSEFNRLLQSSTV